MFWPLSISEKKRKRITGSHISLTIETMNMIWRLPYSASLFLCSIYDCWLITYQAFLNDYATHCWSFCSCTMEKKVFFWLSKGTCQRAPLFWCRSKVGGVAAKKGVGHWRMPGRIYLAPVNQHLWKLCSSCIRRQECKPLCAVCDCKTWRSPPKVFMKISLLKWSSRDRFLFGRFSSSILIFRRLTKDLSRYW